MKISIDKGSGFCFGVSSVIDMAEEIIDSGQKLYCLGEIVHNEKEVSRLVRKGMTFIEVSDLKNLKNVNVLIRAHGEPPSTYELCKENNINIIDGTCPIVKKVQKRIRKTYTEQEKDDSQIIIYGKEWHPEVIGLNGQTNNSCLVVSAADQLNVADLKKNVTLFSQTTMDTDGYREIVEKINKAASEGEAKQINFNNTICKHISHRQPQIARFAKENELVIFVAGKKSSNGKILFEICKKENPKSHLVSKPEEVQKEWLNGINSIGISGGTSTPLWLLNLVAEKVRELLTVDGHQSTVTS